MNAIDYFAILGRPEGPLQLKQVSSIWSEKKVHPSVVWNEAIVDIGVIQRGDKLPDDTWQLLDTSVDGEEIPENIPLLAIRKRSESDRLDHIIEIKLLKSSSVLPWGYELIDKTISGNGSAELSEDLGYIIIKRADITDKIFLESGIMLDDICLVLQHIGEEVPEGYTIAEKLHVNLKDNITSMINNTKLESKLNQQIIKLVYHSKPSICLFELGFESATLDRYPKIDHKNRALPTKELPLFAFTHDLRVRYSVNKRFPIPVFFTFVFTDLKGDHLYAACLRFYELIEHNEYEKQFKNIYGDKHIKMLPNVGVYCPKIISVISSLPCYRAERTFLRQIYSMSMSSIPCPIEYYIASIISQVPIPYSGGRSFQIIQDAALISSSSKSMGPISFDIPIDNFFPFLDLDFAAPLRCLSIENILVLLALMLREAKIVFMCDSHTLLTETMETMKSFLFPLQWDSCFVSRLPWELAGMLQAPGGFMIGLQIPDDGDSESETVPTSMIDEDDNVDDNKIDNNLEMKINNKYRKDWSKVLAPGTYIVDLSSNRILQSNGNNEILLKSSQLNNISNTLPYGPKKRVEKKLQSIIKKVIPKNSNNHLELFDSAFDISSNNEDIPSLEIRDIFMVFMIDILGNYAKYIAPINSSKYNTDTYRTFKESYMVEDYINDADSSMRSLILQLSETQMFAVLIQKRIDCNDKTLLFFDDASDLLRCLGLCIGGHGMKPANNSTISNIGLELPAPLCKLLKISTHYLYKDLFLQSLTNYSSTPSISSAVRMNNAINNSIKQTNAINVLVNSLINYEFEANKIIKSSSLRNEIDTIFELSDLELIENLFDNSLSALIIPGPLKKENDHLYPEIEQELNIHKSSDGLYKYYSWPLLNSTLLEHSNIHLSHPILKKIKELKLKVSNNINPKIYNLIRPFSEQYSYKYNGKLCSITKSNVRFNLETGAVIGVIGDIIKNCMIMLEIRVIMMLNPINDILQILGLVALMEEKGVLTDIDENVWVGILIGCSVNGGVFMRKIASVIYDCLVNSCDCIPNIYSTGYYMKSISAKKNSKYLDNKIIIDNKYVDIFFYLEEIGLTWMLQSFALMKQEVTIDRVITNTLSPSPIKISSNSSSSQSNSPWNSMSKQWDSVVNKNKSTPTSLTTPPITNKAYNRIVSNNTVSYIANQLNLIPFPGKISLLTPKFSIFIRSLLHINQFDQIEDIDMNSIKSILNQRINDFVSTQEVDVIIPKLNGSINSNSIGNTSNNRNSIDSNNNINPIPSTVEVSSPLSPFPSPSPMKDILSRKLGNIIKDMKSVPGGSPTITSTTTSASVTPISKSMTSSEKSITGRFSAFYNKISSSPKTSSNTHTNQITNDSIDSSQLNYTTNLPRINSNDRSNLEIFLEGKDKNSCQYNTKELDFFEEDDGEDDDDEDDGHDNYENSHAVDVVSSVECLDDFNNDIVKFVKSNNESQIYTNDLLLDFSHEDGFNTTNTSTTNTATTTNTIMCEIDNLIDLEDNDENAPVDELISSSNLLNDFMNDADEKEVHNEEVVNEIIMEDIIISLNKINHHDNINLMNDSFTAISNTEEINLLQNVNQDVCINNHINISTGLSLDFDEEYDITSNNTQSIDMKNQPLINEVTVVDTTITSNDNNDTFSIEYDNTKDPSISTKIDASMSVVDNNGGNEIISTNVTNSSIELLESTSKKLSTSTMDTHLKLSDCYNKLYKSSKKVIGMYSRTPCSGCGMALLDEEILSNWCGFGENKIINNNNVYDAHKIVCKECQTSYQPLLTINCFEINKKNHNNDTDDDMKLIWSSQVRYLSPYGVRFGLEESMQLLGEKVIIWEKLYKIHPDIYWGLQWYSMRLNTPTGFYNSSINKDISNNNTIPWDIDTPIIIGWRKDLVNKKIINFNNNINNDFLLKDILPGCSEEYYSKLDKSMVNLDESLYGLRDLIICFMSFDGSELSKSLQTGEIVGRNIYMGLLFLITKYKKFIDSPNKIIPDDKHSRGGHFDRKFTETVKCALSHQDFETYNTCEEELLKYVENKATQSFRIGIGFLF